MSQGVLKNRRCRGGKIVNLIPKDSKAKLAITERTKRMAGAVIDGFFSSNATASIINNYCLLKIKLLIKPNVKVKGVNSMPFNFLNSKRLNILPSLRRQGVYIFPRP